MGFQGPGGAGSQALRSNRGSVAEPMGREQTSAGPHGTHHTWRLTPLTTTAQATRGLGSEGLTGEVTGPGSHRET